MTATEVTTIGVKRISKFLIALKESSNPKRFPNNTGTRIVRSIPVINVPIAEKNAILRMLKCGSPILRPNHPVVPMLAKKRMVISIDTLKGSAKIMKIEVKKVSEPRMRVIQEQTRMNPKNKFFTF